MMMCLRIVFRVTILLFALFPLFDALELPRGVSPSRASFYQVGQTFKCLNGSGVIPWHQVNDNYCDCADGSDEPGTSACANGQFFCRDTHYKVVSLRTSLVNDGVCDCCDGSDEYAGRVTCESTCGVLAAAVEQARLLKQKEVERGHSIFKEYVAKLKVRKEEERIAAERAELERQLKAEQQPEEEQVTVPSEPQPSEPDESNTPEGPEIGEHETKNQIKFDISLEHDEDRHEEEGSESEHTEGDHTYDAPPPEPVVEKPKPIDYGPEEAFRMLEELPNCLEYTDPQYTYRFCAFKDIYQSDRGSSGQGTLLGRWAGWATDEEDAPASHKYSLMKFYDGMGCWNGPARSVKVHVHCGAENQLSDVKEPSRCEYEMQLHTPAACFEHPEVFLERFHAEL